MGVVWLPWWSNMNNWRNWGIVRRWRSLYMRRIYILTFKSFLSTHTLCLGKICLKVRIQIEAMHINFYVANKNHKGFAIVLGRSWMCSTNCQINLRTREYTLEVNSASLTGKDSEEDLLTKEEMPNQSHIISSHSVKASQTKAILFTP